MPATYEVDHPATQRVKRTRVADRPHVHYVPVDLNEQSLAGALGRSGFPRRRTVVIWEGVTNYLTAQAVDATLRDLAAAVEPGSAVVLTYVDRAALDGDTTWHREVAKVGEPWTFGLDPAEVPGYLAERGLELHEDLSTQEAAARYHRPDEPAAAFYRVAWARDTSVLSRRFGALLNGPASRWRRCRKAQVQPGTRTFRRLASGNLDPPISTPTSDSGH